jgi:hypothetical protein
MGDRIKIIGLIVMMKASVVGAFVDPMMGLFALLFASAIFGAGYLPRWNK